MKLPVTRLFRLPISNVYFPKTSTSKHSFEYLCNMNGVLPVKNVASANAG
uniref:Uncharacterized protein n=1 Tax=Populus trichocarpa TaxID=3694 RepID=A0A3N7FLU2_POPTR